MTTEQFRSEMRRQPFQPFTIRMADGRALEVAHPEFASLSPSGRTAIVYQADDYHSVLDLLLMTEIEVQGANGHTA